jgi:SAM-dependent methyltransferase
MSKDEWAEYADSWDDDVRTRRYARLAFESWQRHASALGPDLITGRVLDFGCGTGLLAERFSPLCSEVVGIDPSPGMMEVFKAKLARRGLKNITGITGEVNRETIASVRQFSDGFDLIIASSVCSFLPDYEATLVDLSALLNAGGVFVQWDWAADMSAKRMANAFEAAGFDTIATDQGFEIEMDHDSRPVRMGVAQRVN